MGLGINPEMTWSVQEGATGPMQTRHYFILGTWASVDFGIWWGLGTNIPHRYCGQLYFFTLKICSPEACGWKVFLQVSFDGFKRTGSSTTVSKRHLSGLQSEACRAVGKTENPPRAAWPAMCSLRRARWLLSAENHCCRGFCDFRNTIHTRAWQTNLLAGKNGDGWPHCLLA